MKIGLESGRTQYDEIDILHVIGAAMILICHFTQKLHIGAVGELFISGVPLFLFISGFLVGCKPFTLSRKNWLKRKATRILIPFYLWVLPTMLILWISDHEMVTPVQFLFMALNLQGLNYIFWPSQLYDAILGLGQLWFVTEIMLCYFLYSMMRHIFDKETSKKKWVAIIAGVILFVQPLLIECGIQTSYLITFFMGALVGRLGVEVNSKCFLGVTGVCSFITIIRIVLKNYIDGTNFYDRYLALISAAAVGIWVFFFVFWIASRDEKIITFIRNSKIISFIVPLTYEIYITHFWYLNGKWEVENYISNPIVADVFVVILTLISSYILHRLSTILTKKIEGVIK